VERYEFNGRASPVDLDEGLIPHLGTLRQGLEDLHSRDTYTAENIQNLVFSVAKENGFNPGQWFTFLYRVLIGKDRGPRLGTFLAMLGKDRTLELLRTVQAEKDDQTA